MARSKAKALGNDLLQCEQAVLLGVERAAIGLADGAAHGEQHHVLRRAVLLVGGECGERAERRDESKEERSHGL